MSIKVHGQEVHLETRVCAGGCGKVFRCVSTCPIVTARANCARACGKNIRGSPWKQRVDRARNWLLKYAPNTIPEHSPRLKPT